MCVNFNNKVVLGITKKNMTSIGDKFPLLIIYTNVGSLVMNQTAMYSFKKWLII